MQSHFIIQRTNKFSAGINHANLNIRDTSVNNSGEDDDSWEESDTNHKFQSKFDAEHLETSSCDPEYVIVPFLPLKFWFSSKIETVNKKQNTFRAGVVGDSAKEKTNVKFLKLIKF